MTFKSMLQKVLGAVGLRLSGAALSLLSQIIFARLFLPEEVGVIFLGMSATALISLVITAGYPSLALTNLPRYQAHDRKTLVEHFHGAFLRDSAALMVLVCAMLAIMCWFLPIDADIKTALFFGCASTPPSLLLRYNSVLANSMRRFSLAFVPDFIYRPGLLLVYVAGIELMGYTPSVVHVLWAFVAVNTSVAIGQAFILGRHGLLPHYWFQFRSVFTKRLRSRAFALVIVAAVATHFSDLVTMLAGFLLPAKEVALLGVSIRLAAVAGFVVQASQQFILPDLTTAIVRRDEALAHSLLLRMNIITIATIGCCLLGVVIFGNFALGLFGPAYQDAKFLLILFLIGQSVRAFSGMNQHLLSIAGHQLRTASACLTALVLLIGLATLLSKTYGAIGIGYAVILAELAWTVLLASQAQNILAKRGDLLWLLRKR